MRNLITFLILTLFLKVFVCNRDLSFDTKTAFTTDGRPCWTNCRVIEGEGPERVCVADESFQPVHCHNTEEDAPVYYTTTGKPCLTRCVPDDKSTGRCIVSQEKQWATCDAESSARWERSKTFTDSSGPCKDACKNQGSQHKCNNYWGFSDVCDPQYGYDYIQARTVSKKCLCRGACKMHQGKMMSNSSSMLCYSDCGTDICALPPVPRTIDMSEEIEELLKLKEPVCIHIHKNKTNEDRRGTLLRQMVVNLENDPFTFLIGILEDETNPIYSFKKGLNGLASVVRAEIFPKHLRAHAMDENTHAQYSKIVEKGFKLLIPYNLGGPIKPYNFIPRTKCDAKYGDAAWSLRDYGMLQHLWGQREPKVELLIVVFYAEGATSPTGTVRQITYYDGIKIVDEFFQYVPCNCTSDSEFIVTSLSPKSLLTSVQDLEYKGLDDDCHQFSAPSEQE